MDTYHRWMKVVVPATLLDCPVIGMPVGFNAEGLAVGMQLIGKIHADFAVLQIAYAYKRDTLGEKAVTAAVESKTTSRLTSRFASRVCEPVLICFPSSSG